MIKYTRMLAVGAGAVMAVGVLAACSSGATQNAAPGAAASDTAVAMPSAATYIADVAEADGSTMTMAITVKDDRVVAYATNGVDDDAYFFGTQHDGKMDLVSQYGDDLTASFDGTDVKGELAMNEPDTAAVEFAAAPVVAPAGLYTATNGQARASFVVRPNRTMTGVMNNSAPGDHKVTDAIAAKDQGFKDSVRKMRLDRQMQQAPQMTYGTWSMTMDGKKVTAVRVTGDMSF